MASALRPRTEPDGTEGAEPDPAKEPILYVVHVIVCCGGGTETAERSSHTERRAGPPAPAQAEERVEARERNAIVRVTRTACVVRPAEGVEARERALKRDGRAPFPRWRPAYVWVLVEPANMLSVLAAKHESARVRRGA